MLDLPLPRHISTLPLSHFDEAPKATFPPVLLRQRGAIGAIWISAGGRTLSRSFTDLKRYS